MLDCVVRYSESDGEKRPRHLDAVGVASRVWSVAKIAGLDQMGVSVRRIEPPNAGTARHYHEIEEEWAYVLSGAGVVRIGPHRLDVRAGSFVAFPPGPRPHHFVADDDSAIVLLEGGERHRDGEVVHYVDLGFRLSRESGQRSDEPGGPEQGDADQCLHVSAAEAFDFQHPVEPRSLRYIRSLHTATGLSRQAVRWAQVRAGSLTTAFHTHDRTEEWVYILEGSAELRVGNERQAVGAGDFIGHRAGSAPHCMEAATELTYLMGGQIDDDDVVLYPEAALQLRGDTLVPL